MMSFLFKHICIFCDNLTNRKIDLCVPCEQELPFLKNCCVRCGKVLSDWQKVCGNCLKVGLVNIETKVFFDYKSPIDKIILNLKFQKNLVGGRVLGELLAEYLGGQYAGKEKPELIIPVPLHFKRLRERGYNQAIEIAKPISKKLNIPIDKFSVIRQKNTQAQATLSLKERGKNLKNAFCIKKKLNCHYVAVVDDVITTGNTVNELCKVLKKAGVGKIDIWCLARRQ